MTDNKAIQNWIEDLLSFDTSSDFHSWLEEQGYEVFLRNPDNTEVPIEVAKALSNPTELFIRD